MSDETEEGFEIVGSVAPEDVPAASRHMNPSKWAKLAQRVVSDHRAGRVTVIRVPNQDEVVRLRNNLSNYLRRDNFTSRTIVVHSEDEIRVFIEVKPYEKKKPDGTAF